MNHLTLGLFVDALQRHSFALDLRPIVTADQHQVVAFEGVLRSDHPALSSPARVVEAASQYHMVDELAAEVGRLASIWLDRLPERVALVVDLHPLEMSDPDAVMARLHDMGQTPSRVILRVPHPGVVLEVPRCNQTIRRIHAAGHPLVIGSAATALGALPFALRVPVRFFQVEADFLRGIDLDPERLTRFERLVALAHKRQARVIVQGMETVEQIAPLRARGADLLAGPIFEVEYGTGEE